eukprot:215210_1
MATHLQFLFLSLITIEASLNDNILRVKNLNGLSSHTKEYQQIFSPRYVNGHHIIHNVHVVDDIGKFFKLEYEALHPSNTDILKIDHPIHKNNTHSLSCHDDENNTIVLNFNSNATASDYFQKIKMSLSNPLQIQLLTASYEWGCFNEYYRRYESLIRKVTDITIDTKMSNNLILNTVHETLFQSHPT